MPFLKKKPKLSQTQNQYQILAKAREAKRPLFLNMIRAFIVGGSICTLGQAIQWFFITYFKFTENAAGNPTVAILIMLSVLFTGLGIYDRLAQWGGAGTAVPVTGFANSIASAAIEHRSEGFVLGVAGKMFELAGAVIVYGVFTAFVIALIKIGIKVLIGI